MNPQPYPPTRRPKYHADMIGLIIAASIVACGLAMLSGCSTRDIDALKIELGKTQQVQMQIDALIADLDARLLDAPAGPVTDELMADLAVAKKIKTQAGAAIEDFRGRIENASSELDLVSAAMQTSAPYVPQPWGLLLGILGTGVGALAEIKRRQTKAAAANIVISLEKTKADKNNTLDFGDPATRDSLRSRMTQHARDLVRQAREKSNTVIVTTPTDAAP